MSQTFWLGAPNLWACERPCAARSARQAVTRTLPQGQLQSDLSIASSKVFVNGKLESKSYANVSQNGQEICCKQHPVLDVVPSCLS